MYHPDEALIETFVSGIRSTLDYYEQFDEDNGLLEHLRWWPLVDWSENHLGVSDNTANILDGIAGKLSRNDDNL